MPELTLDLSTAPASESSADAVVLFAVAGDEAPQLVDGDGYDWVPDALESLGASAVAEEITRLPARDGGPRRILVAGVGPTADAPAIRLAAGAALRQVGEAAAVGLALHGASDELVAAALEGAALGAYRFTRYRSEAKPGPSRIVAHATGSAEAIGLDRVRIVAEAVAETKDLVNTPPDDLTPERFAEIARAATEDASLSYREWDVPALEAGGFGGILDVGRGSANGPRLVRVEYAPTDARFTLALVGKGITFDSGGLSLKPAASMVGMKTDMAGAAAVLHAIVALARLRTQVRVIGWLCLAENMPSSTALRPTDVITINGGTTVEVLNTDAEGRLVLADGLVAAGEDHPDAIIDVATLTGAQLVALGGRIAGLMGDDELVARVRASADAVDEAVWPMPLPDYLRGMLKSDVADLANAKLGTVLPGMSLAGVFLREFVPRDETTGERIPWAHLDIAGPSNNTGAAWGFTGSGGTGSTVRTLVRLGEDLSGK
ncbi:leucyl aminopeptidase [Agromyces sp. LHK192]|uniref:leucyl aminopeptidase n=1 Tax=Agromyces sp. LHK192 TaxID=2498704 RepID=UPI000FD7321F|nr:leucyl aminopeptidase [Agromyces sp. LHK192]